MNVIKSARKLIVLVIGLTILAVGMVMIVTPGPAVVVIPIGLAVLGTEFVWAKRLLRKLREEGNKIGTAIFHTKSRSKDGSDSQSAA